MIHLLVSFAKVQKRFKLESCNTKVFYQCNCDPREVYNSFILCRHLAVRFLFSCPCDLFLHPRDRCWFALLLFIEVPKGLLVAVPPCFVEFVGFVVGVLLVDVDD